MEHLAILWAPVPRTGGLYEASIDGQVRRAIGGPGAVAGRLLKPTMKQGYAWIVWSENNVRHNSGVHTFVAEAWLRLPSEDEEINHKDGNHGNNHVFNLEWVSHSENMKHSYRQLKRNLPPAVFRKGSGHPGSKLDEVIVAEVHSRLAHGERVGDIARFFGVSHGLISQIKSGRCWQHVSSAGLAVNG